MMKLGCILSKFYIKPQQDAPNYRSVECCILSKFYIKPQPAASVRIASVVVSYRNSTSNHNIGQIFAGMTAVVSYRNSTSNHNIWIFFASGEIVVSYRNSTSNHNSAPAGYDETRLYLIEILHQTTTCPPVVVGSVCCILSKFYIKPQLQPSLALWLLGCILSKFYIKPQHMDASRNIVYVVSYRNSTSNHNLRTPLFLHS